MQINRSGRKQVGEGESGRGSEGEGNKGEEDGEGKMERARWIKGILGGRGGGVGARAPPPPHPPPQRQVLVSHNFSHLYLCLIAIHTCIHDSNSYRSTELPIDLTIKDQWGLSSKVPFKRVNEHVRLIECMYKIMHTV